MHFSCSPSCMEMAVGFEISNPKGAQVWNKLMTFFQGILYAPNVQDDKAHKNSCGYVGDDMHTYENWNRYLENYWKKKELPCY